MVGQDLDGLFRQIEMLSDAGPADGSRREIAIRQSKPQAIRSILKGALLDAHARQAMTQDQRKAVALVGRTPGLGEAFREVSEIGAYWSVVSPAVFDPCRKNFCIEVRHRCPG